jgi:hypothetical protein
MSRSVPNGVVLVSSREFISDRCAYFGLNVVSYYFVPVLVSVGVTSATEQTLVTGGLAVRCLHAYADPIPDFKLGLCGLWSSYGGRLGRRSLWLTGLSLMLVFMIIVTVLSATFVKTPGAGIGGATIAFLYLFYGAYDIGGYLV